MASLERGRAEKPDRRQLPSSTAYTSIKFSLGRPFAAELTSLPAIWQQLLKLCQCQESGPAEWGADGQTILSTI